MYGWGPPPLKVWNTNCVPNNSTFHRNPVVLHKSLYLMYAAHVVRNRVVIGRNTFSLRSFCTYLQRKRFMRNVLGTTLKLEMSDSLHYVRFSKGSPKGKSSILLYFIYSQTGHGCELSLQLQSQI